jgi:hypothetical protein
METAAPKHLVAEIAKKIFFAPVIASFLIGSLPVLLPTLLYRAVARSQA